MKNKITFVFLTSIIVMSFLLTGCSGSAQEVETSAVQVQQVQQVQDAKLECPRELDHDPAPGMCPLYRDDNKDGFCDFE